MRVISYGKLIDGELKMFSNPLVDKGKQIYNPTEAQLIICGWKPVSFKDVHPVVAKLPFIKTTNVYSEDSKGIYIEQVPQFNPNDLVEFYTNRAQQYLDDFAKEKNYSDIVSLCSYANSNHPKFRAEAVKGILLRDQVWQKCYALLDEYGSTTDFASIPSESEFVAMLPVASWD